ncbi:conserved membrane hypothetical protein [[Clostridium] ultunense Esp]|nr:conserved membrane hypothetical protein [[Clostridium] ultunense Esp]
MRLVFSSTPSVVLFFLLLLFLAAQRMGELILARRNGRWIKEQGGFEVGKGHYPFFILLHLLFFFSLLGEFFWKRKPLPSWWAVPLIFFLLSQGLRYSAISSLGPFWNTRIYILPRASLHPKGPYRFLRHPNYLAVMAELISFPLTFGLYGTAILFSLLNLPLMIWRIR